jgi:hypothetical protein
LKQGDEEVKILKLQLNKADDYTSIFYPASKQEYSYFSIEEALDRSRGEDTSKIVFRVYVELDYRYKFTERKVYNFYDMLGQVGGVMSILLPIGGLFTRIFSSTIFQMTLMSKLYKIENDGHDHSETKFSKSKVLSKSILNEENK